MSEIESLVKEINTIRVKISNLKTERSTQHSILDKWQDDILHKVENSEKFSLYDAWLLVVELKEVRKLRRKVKDDLVEIDLMKDITPLLQSINDKYKNRLKSKENLTYKEKINEQTKTTVMNAIKSQLPQDDDLKIANI